MTIRLNIIDKTIRDIENAANDRVWQAAVHVRGKLKDKARTMFKKQRGDLITGMVADKRDTKAYAVVGAGAPAYHAHLLEFGTNPRTVQHYRGTGGQVAVGRIKPQPFILPTFEEEKDSVEKILSGTWIE
jgi:HK97 gp10 family phage protein